MSNILDAKIKQKGLVGKSHLVENSDLNTKLETKETKAELKTEQDKIVTLQVFESSYVHG